MQTHILGITDAVLPPTWGGGQNLSRYIKNLLTPRGVHYYRCVGGS